MYYRLCLAMLLAGALIVAPLTTDFSDSVSASQSVDVSTIFILDDCTKHAWFVDKYSQFVSYYTLQWFKNSTNSAACYDFTDNEQRNIWFNFFEIEQSEITLFIVDNRVPHHAKWLGVADQTTGITHAQISYNVNPDSKIISHELAHQLAHKKYNDYNISVGWVHCTSDAGQYDTTKIGKTPFYYLKPYDGSRCKHVDDKIGGVAPALGRYLDYRLENWVPRDDYDMFILEFDTIANCTEWQISVPNSLNDDVQFQVAHLYGDTMNFATITIKEDTTVQYCTPAGLEVYAAMLWVQDKAK